MANVQSIPSTITSGSQGQTTSFRGNVKNSFHPLELSPFYLFGPKGYDDGVWRGSGRNLATTFEVLTIHPHGRSRSNPRLDELITWQTS